MAYSCHFENFSLLGKTARCANKKTIPRKKIMYFSKGSMDLSHTFRICI